MKKTFCYSLLLIILLTAIFSINYLRRMNTPLFDIDEAAWIDSSYFYHLFISGDWKSSEWKKIDAVDHPPFAKYMMGLFLTLARHPVNNSAFKQEWHQRDEDKPGLPDFVEELRDTLDPTALQAGRLMSSLFFWLSAILLYFILAEAFSKKVGAIAAVFFSLYELVQILAARAISEGVLIFLMLAILRVQQVWFQKFKKQEKVFWVSGLLGFLLGLVFLTKLTGVLSLATTIALLIYLSLYHPRTSPSAPRFFGSFFVMIGTFLITTFILNPSLNSHPIDFITHMFQYRDLRLELQGKLFYLQAMPNLGLRLSTFLSSGLLYYDWIFKLTGIPFFALLLATGIVSCFFLELPAPLKIFLVNAVVWTFATLFTFQINWTRYLLPTAPFVAAFVAVGIVAIWEMARNKNKNRLLFLGLSLLLYTGFAALPIFYNLPRYVEGHPETYQKKEIEYWLLLSELYPEKYQPEKIKKGLESIENKLEDSILIENTEVSLHIFLRRLKEFHPPLIE